MNDEQNDGTDAKESLDQLRRLRAQMREREMTVDVKLDLILLMTLEGIARINQDGIITFCDYSLCQSFGYENEGELVGQHFNILVPARLREQHDALFIRWWEDPIPLRMDRGTVSGLRKNGEEFQVRSGLILDGDEAIFAIRKS